MFWNRELDVLVAGAGPVGMFASLLLADRGLRVRLIDEQYRCTAQSYALGLHPRSLELLDEAGVADELISRGRPLSAMAFYSGNERRAELSFSKGGSRFPFLLVLPQCTLEEVLERHLLRRKVRVEWKHRLESARPAGKGLRAVVHELARESTGYAAVPADWIVDQELTVRSSYVLGADGHRSTVRRQLGIPFDEVGSSQLFAVFEFSTEGPDLDEARVAIDNAGVSVLWPLGNGRFRLGFEMKSEAPPESPREKSRLFVVVGDSSFVYLHPDSLQKLIAARTPWFEHRIGEIRWSMAVRFERRLAGRFGQGRTWLAGDAAHLSPPIGLWSMNIGLREAADLAWRLAAVLREESAPSMLDIYGHNFFEEWRALLTSRPTRPASGAAGWAEQNADQILPCIPASGEELAKLLAQLGLAQTAAHLRGKVD
jgi:2-polyprenyl-6-methoxyphenol hydroxylase-like FAD-dependent oxidoreductase